MPRTQNKGPGFEGGRSSAWYRRVETQYSHKFPCIEADAYDSDLSELNDDDRKALEQESSARPRPMYLVASSMEGEINRLNCYPFLKKQRILRKAQVERRRQRQLLIECAAADAVARVEQDLAQDRSGSSRLPLEIKHVEDTFYLYSPEFIRHFFTMASNQVFDPPELCRYLTLYTHRDVERPDSPGKAKAYVELIRDDKLYLDPLFIPNNQQRFSFGDECEIVEDGKLTYRFHFLNEDYFYFYISREVLKKSEYWLREADIDRAPAFFKFVAIRQDAEVMNTLPELEDNTDPGYGTGDSDDSDGVNKDGDGDENHPLDKAPVADEPAPVVKKPRLTMINGWDERDSVEISDMMPI